MAISGADQFLTIAELGGNIAWVIDLPAAQLRYISPHVDQLSGYSAAAWHGGKGGVGSLMALLMSGLPARLARFAGGDASRQQLARTVEIPHRNGQKVPVEIVSRIMAGADGAPQCLVGMVRDLSQQRDHEAGQRRFASMLNHEFRTPLSTIDGAIQRLQVTGAQADPATRERYRKIGAAVEQMIGMLEQYLSPDVVSASGTAPRANRLNPRRLLEESALLARAAGREASLDLGDLPTTLRGEPQGVRLALKVLTDNALQYGAAGSPLAFTGQLAADSIVLSVKNVGPGVPEQETAVIFSKKFRGSNSAMSAGAGLGLYMARAVIEVHGGVIALQQGPLVDGQRETVFSISLPLRTSTGKDVA